MWQLEANQSGTETRAQARVFFRLKSRNVGAEPASTIGPFAASALDNGVGGNAAEPGGAGYR